MSVIIPTYNRAGLIGRSLQSVLNQTHQDIEVIVVDDASQDDTEQQVRAFSDDRIRYVRHDGTRGPSATRNTGIKNARCDYVAFLDSDDQWLPEKLERQLVEFTLDQEIGFVYCGWAWIRGDRSIRASRVPDPKTGLIGNTPRWFFNMVQDLVIRRQLLDDCLFNESIWAYENLEWLLRLVHRAPSGFVADILVRCHEDASHRASDSRLKKLEGLEFILSNYRSYLEGYGKLLFHLRLSAGALALQEKDPRAKGHLAAAARLRPLSARTWVRFVKASLVS